ncbi:murein biosynthesis integral membrane protein MurJ [Streptomyces griseomycini]|uniref:Peptidoglycan lipid II flippase n=1 Tax=Streptomyces griseomycini TaxID=66895 RepID=A0A7W7V893_9ACTN|nr:lipid II flippase MurJ [Streptomyces griseomycini]MBB4900931.1 putative peptidoglycan lipid II flippase [Streptomyces griseomycini]GGP87390.1 membrane protein [Streptomyces griseomycini]GGR15624.1 membrane protein [Streptomyces griseomycini]
MTVVPSRTPGSAADEAATVPAARTAGPAGDGGDHASPSRGFLARAALVTASLSVAGSLLGLVRDQSLARLFGAGSDTDAFLVAWTVPEIAATLLIEDGLAIALIPAFSVALARRARGAAGDPVRALVAATLPRLCLAFAAVAALVAATAPYLVRGLAPGLPDPGLAVDCTRLTAISVLAFGLAGYCSAALRAHRRFFAPAAIYVAYNTGIVAAMFLLGGAWGVRSAAVGVAVGGCLMVAVQLPSLLRRLASRGPAPDGAGAGASADTGSDGGSDGGERPVRLALLAAVLLFALCRQSQVLVERFLASSLPAGAISHLNYAQKVAQIPMTLSLMLCTVTFPVVARALADGDTERARARVERDLVLASCVVLLGAAAVLACAPQMVELLFQRGAFTAGDTAATADVMRVYALGLLGQTLVGALIRSYFSTGRPSWYPVGVMAVGVVATSLIGTATVDRWGVAGIAAANAFGITVTAALLLAGLRTARRAGSPGVSVRVRRVLAGLGGPVLAAAAATAAGALAAGRPESSAAGLAAGCLTVTAVFAALSLALGVQGSASALRSVRTVTRRLAHGRFR